MLIYLGISKLNIRFQLTLKQVFKNAIYRVLSTPITLDFSLLGYPTKTIFITSTRISLACRNSNSACTTTFIACKSIYSACTTNYSACTTTISVSTTIFLVSTTIYSACTTTIMASTIIDFAFMKCTENLSCM